MKKILLLLALTGLVSCTPESVLDEGKAPLDIVVDVATYNRDVNSIPTRASINEGVVTSFAPGDDFGLIVVDDQGNLVADNYRYVVQKTGHGYRVDDTGKVISSDVYYNDNYTYIAYAPYNKDFNGYRSIDAITAKHKNEIATKYADQSTQAQYNAADLLVYKGKNPVHQGTTLRLTFSHAMSLLKIYYNGDYKDLTVEYPVTLSQMFKPDGAATYSYIYPPQDKLELYGTTQLTSTSEEGDDQTTSTSYWQTYVDLKENGMLYVSIYSQPEVSYKTAGVDMGFPSGCIWAAYNLGTESETDMKNRGGKWYDADGNEKNVEGELHKCYDRGHYYSWGELKTKYGQPSLLFNAETGRISDTGDAIKVASDGTKSLTSLVSGSDKGYYPETYIDRKYSYAEIDGNIAGTEYDVVRNVLWKGEWRIPNENEIDELMRNCNIEICDIYYEDNVRYAPWITEKNEDGTYKNLHPDNSEFWGTAEVRPYRYMVPIFKFTSKINGEVLYFPGGTWSDWSIDMLATNSRSHDGLISTTTFNSDYGGMYYFASSASHTQIDCSSYMEMETRKTVDQTTGKITKVEPIMKTSSYVDKNGQTIELKGLTQNGHRYTGMLIRPVYGGRNWNTNTETRNTIRIKVE